MTEEKKLEDAAANHVRKTSYLKDQVIPPARETDLFKAGALWQKEQENKRSETAKKILDETPTETRDLVRENGRLRVELERVNKEYKELGDKYLDLMSKENWTQPVDGVINVPDRLDKLFNRLGTQLRFHTISGKGEAETVASMTKIADDHAEERYHEFRLLVRDYFRATEYLATHAKNTPERQLHLEEAVKCSQIILEELTLKD
jgi:predicted nuclease with TOPRIM domain